MTDENKIPQGTPEPEGTPETEHKGEPTPEPEGKAAAKYTDDDVNEILNRKFAKWEAAKAKELEEERRKATLSAEELQKLEAQEKDSKIADYERRIAQMEITSSANARLATKGLAVDDETLSFVLRDTEEETLKAVDALSNFVEKAINERIKASARQQPPKASASKPTQSGESLSDFAAKNRLIKN